MTLLRVERALKSYGALKVIDSLSLTDGSGGPTTWPATQRFYRAVLAP